GVSPQGERSSRSGFNYFAEHKALATAIVLCVIVLAAAGSLYLKSRWSRSRAVANAQWHSSLLTTTGHAMDAAISRDGRYLAYRNEESDLVSIRLKEIATGNEVEVTPPSPRFVFDP